LGQVVSKLFIDPLAVFRQRRGEVAYLVLRHQAKIVNAAKVDDAVRDEFRQHAANLMVAMAQVPCFPLFRLFRIPSRKSVRAAAGELNFLAHSFGDPKVASQNLKALDRLADYLGVSTRYTSPNTFIPPGAD
jgi:hypothetical protein